ncbi:MAG TPA: DUF4403 family protein [Xanthobacteraceae bacterium]|nr:DUF4403 family protein [Xanthobacteraceae bacterium]
MRLRNILIGLAIVVASFLGASVAMQFLSPGPANDQRPALVEVPPLKQLSRTSMIVTPTAIALTAIQDALDASAPRNLTGKRENPISQLLSNADIGWTIGRGPLAVSGSPGGMAVSTALTGTLHVTGQIASQVGNIGGALGGIINQNLGQGLQNLTGKTLDQHAEIRGNAAILARPAITANWRMEPNLTAQVTIGDSALSIAGIKIGVANEVKPMLDRQVNEQVAALQARLRADPFLEQAARRQWAKMCRSVSLGAAGAGLPDLWLEVRPTRAFAGQPRIDAQAVTLVIGVQAETRVVPAQTQPDCPFPAALELVPQSEQGRVNIAVPIDVPFTEVNRLLAVQLIGKTFPQDGSGPYEATIRTASVAASGDRLLIALRVKAREKASWFGLGAEANVNVWGRPVLDRDRQILRLTDIALDVDSEAAFGLLSAAARAAVPYLKDTLADNAVIDLKPFADNARKSMAAAIADFRTVAAGVQADVNFTDLRLLDIEFDAKTLRVIAEANGTANVTVSSLPAP